MRALTLEYHDVIAGDDFDASGFPGPGPGSYKLKLSDFEAHLDATAARGVTITRITDWIARADRERPVFLTFDDGGQSAATDIADALERHGWVGHFFVTAGRIDTRAFLSARAIRDLHRRGHVIGSHSYSHPKMMGACTPAQVLDEWRRSVGLLTDVIGEQVYTASVPGGFYREFVAQAAAETGLKALFTSTPTTYCTSVDGCLVLGRYTLRRWSKAATAAAIAAGSIGPRFSQALLYGTLSLVRSVAGNHYTRLRQRFWASRG